MEQKHIHVSFDLIDKKVIRKSEFTETGKRSDIMKAIKMKTLFTLTTKPIR